MKSRVLITVLVVALAAAAIGGATLAWFTDSATSEDVTFAAGTLLINVDNEPVVTAMEDRSIDKVNPGDCATVCWNIVNEGTKSAELRAKIDAGWVNASNDPQVAFFAPVPDSGWVMYEENGETWLYYTGGPVAGTYGNEEGDSAETVSLCLVVGFDGPLMGNDYQAESYEISGIVEAVQSTNGAPEAQWGDALAEVKDENYSESPEYEALMGYFLTGNGASMPCWNGGEPTKKTFTYDKLSMPYVSTWQNGSRTCAKLGVKLSGVRDEQSVLANATLTVTAYYPGYEEQCWSGEVEFIDGYAHIEYVYFCYPIPNFNNSKVIFEITS